MKKEKLNEGWYDYEVTGTLGKTENQVPVMFTVSGRYNEKWSTSGPVASRKGIGTMLIPTEIEKQLHSLGEIPLGTKVRFRDSAWRWGLSYSRSFSLTVIEGKRRHL